MRSKEGGRLGRGGEREKYRKIRRRGGGAAAVSYQKDIFPSNILYGGGPLQPRDTHTHSHNRC